MDQGVTTKMKLFCHKGFLLRQHSEGEGVRGMHDALMIGACSRSNWLIVRRWFERRRSQYIVLVWHRYVRSGNEVRP